MIIIILYYLNSYKYNNKLEICILFIKSKATLHIYKTCTHALGDMYGDVLSNL
jgi:hypothetical protein